MVCYQRCFGEIHCFYCNQYSFRVSNEGGTTYPPTIKAETIFFSYFSWFRYLWKGKTMNLRTPLRLWKAKQWYSMFLETQFYEVSFRTNRNYITRFRSVIELWKEFLKIYDRAFQKYWRIFYLRSVEWLLESTNTSPLHSQRQNIENYLRFWSPGFFWTRLNSL